MRPKKRRTIYCGKIERWFRPRCMTRQKLENVYLELDEFEALRLVDKEGLQQKEAAFYMGISRPTLSRIVNAARKKVSEALVELKGIKIEGVSCCQISKTKLKKLARGGKENNLQAHRHN